MKKTWEDIVNEREDQSYKPGKMRKVKLAAGVRAEARSTTDKGEGACVDYGARQTANKSDKKKRTPRQKSQKTWSLELTKQALVAAGLPCPDDEHRFHPVRRWRFDIAWTKQKVALEVEGGVWTKGRHTRGTGFIRDIEKYNTAAALGWVVLRCIPEWLPGDYGASIDGDLIDQLTRLFTLRKAA